MGGINMIDEDRTMQLFGYTSGELGKGSHKKVVVVCEECGRHRIIEKGGYRDLCKSCSLAGEKSPHWNGGKITRVCEMCGKEFSTKPSLTKNGKGRFCSHKCQGKWESEVFCGENSPQFGKTVSVEARQKISATLQHIAYDEWESFAEDHPYCPKFNNACRESNREKYDRRCFLSGTTEAQNGKKLSVHHNSDGIVYVYQNLYILLTTHIVLRKMRRT